MIKASRCKTAYHPICNKGVTCVRFFAEPDRTIMDPLVDCVLEDARWADLGLEGLALRAASATLSVLDLALDQYTLCVMGCNDARIATLNAQFRGKPTPTNVLSWPAEDLSPDAPGQEPYWPGEGDPQDPLTLGDIALAYDTCAREAVEGEKPLADHVTHLIVHGLLHCLGYDHIHDEDAERMEGLEVRILASLGLSDPY
jgi:probable rRNA maturation factor